MIHTRTNVRVWMRKRMRCVASKKGRQRHEHCIEMSNAIAVTPLVTLQVPGGGTIDVTLPTFVAAALPIPFDTAAPISRAWDGNCTDLLVSTAVSGPSGDVAAVNTLAPGNLVSASFTLLVGSFLASQFAAAPLNDSSGGAVLAMTTASTGTLTTAAAVYSVVGAMLGVSGLDNASVSDMPCTAVMNGHA